MTEINALAKATTLPPLRSNGFDLDPSPARLGRLAPTEAGEGLATIRQRFEAEGYVWLKGFLPRRHVLDFRGHFFSAFTDTRLLRPGSDPEEGLWSGEPNDENLARKRLMEQVRSAGYEAFCMHRRLWRFMDEFVGGPSYLHKRKLIRFTRPGDEAATPAHYDLIYLRGGTHRLVTVWIPIGDTPVEMGGLVYLEGSHVAGREMEAEFAENARELPPEERISAYNRHMGEGGWISKDLPALADRLDRRWLAADYEAGDVVLHSPFMIHAATRNDDPRGRLRLSTDIRYQNVRDEIDARWANHWSLGDML
jgi:ectoine hydroxylase-related dioxygenase (phytanoyl-CoA dioxygenase family)